MLSKNPIKLKDNKKISVKVQPPNKESFYTEINLEYGRAPSIGVILDDEEKSLTVESALHKHHGEYFLTDFYEYELINSSIFNYLFVGKADKDNIKKVYFNVPELSSYFLHELDYQVDVDSNISGNLKIEPLETRIEHLGLSIKIHQGFNFQSDEDHTGFSFKNIVYLSFESDSNLSFQDIENLMYKTIRLLTWITGYPVTIDSIEVSDGVKNGYLYLPSLKKIKTYNLKNPYCFMKSGYFRENFQTICSNFFDKREIFDEIWSRTIPLFEFTGVLEYEVMLYASILDKYFSYHIEKKATDKIENYESCLEEIGKFLKENEQLKDLLKNTELLKNIKLHELKAVFPESKFQSFLSKQKEFFRMIDAKDLKIFLKSNDFIKIISIRNNAAHGSREKLSTDDVLEYSWKVKLLTMYLIYMDLGVKNDDFFKIISNTFHPIVLGCEKDKDLLDLKIGKMIILPLSKTEIDKMNRFDTKIKVFIQKKENYLFNSELSQKTHDYFSEDIITKIDPSKIYSSEKYVQHLLDENNTDMKAKLYSRAFLKDNSSKVLIHNVIILSPKD